MSQKYIRLTGKKDAPTSEIVVEELEGTDLFRVTIDGVAHEVTAFPTNGRVTVIRDGRSMDMPIEHRAELTIVNAPTGRAKHEIMDKRIYDLQVAMGAGPGSAKPELKSPMAGKIVLVNVEPGQTVKAGETLLIIEAMKMENEIRAEADTVIKSVLVKGGDIIDAGAKLIEFVVD